MTSRPATSLRTRQPAHTEAAARSLMAALGISEVTEITALDKLGLPVFVSVRPEGRAAQVHAGKGLSAQDACVGALMEALECAVAQQAADAPCVHLPLADLAEGLPDALTLADFSPQLEAIYDAERPTAAVCCADLLQARRTWLPAELVLVPPPEDPLPPLFGWCSNGLASGNTVGEATLHGLFEVLERDTLTMSLMRGSAAFVDGDTLPEPLAAHAERWRGLGVELHVRHLPNEFGLPCFEATLYESGAPPALMLARGWGLHFDRRVALARAVSEAAQARACRLHGSQPESAALYASRLRSDDASVTAAAGAREQFVSTLARRSRPALRFEDLPHAEPADVAGALRELLARLTLHGFNHVFRRRMRHAGLARAGLHVVKVIVPRCENLLSRKRRAGPRLLALAAERA